MLEFNRKSLDDFVLIPGNYPQTITCINLDSCGDATTRAPQKSKPTSLKQSPIPEEDATLPHMNYFLVTCFTDEHFSVEISTGFGSVARNLFYSKVLCNC